MFKNNTKVGKNYNKKVISSNSGKKGCTLSVALC